VDPGAAFGAKAGLDVSAEPAWIGIAGPTASGKTALALAVAQRFGCEIISVDSALVYRDMDIGTAKPTVAERALAPHHLINIREPHEPYSAAEFAADATRLIAEIRGRGKRPLLVGGTMLYFKALMEGLDTLPAANAEIRARLDEQARSIGWPAMHAELARVDPITAQRLAPNDAQRIQRALEVWQASGQPLSSFHSGPKTSAQPLHLIALEPSDRAWLHARIAERFAAMLDAGLIDEVRNLRTTPGLHADLPAMRAVGYRQVWEALDEGLADDALRRTVQARGTAATRQLAKRQLTWLRSMAARTSVPCDAPDAHEQALAFVRTLWAN
jgi:tRNA dimethylallyltransferase